MFHDPTFPTRFAGAAVPRPQGPAPQRALVLGGGGSTGNAWLIGVIAGLADGGVDVADADLTISTSAGSTAAVQLVGQSAAELYAATQQEPDAAARPYSQPAGRPSARQQVGDHLARLRGIIDGSESAQQMQRALGAAALALDGAGELEFSARWRSIVAARFTAQAWPARRLYLTALDAHSGEGVVFDRFSGVPLPDAVAASCSSTLPYLLGSEAYLDGGYRRNENADLAAGCARVLVLSPLGGRTLHPLEWGMQLDAQVEQLRAGGSAVQLILPDAGAEPLMGVRAMEQGLRPAAAREGFRQGSELAARVGDFWR